MHMDEQCIIKAVVCLLKFSQIQSKNYSYNFYLNFSNKSQCNRDYSFAILTIEN